MLFRKLALLAAFGMILFGCEQAPDLREQVNVEELKRSLDQAAKTLSDITPSRKDIQDQANLEVEKLFAFEYKVVELDREAPSQRLEAILSQLGKDRWQCFHIEPRGSKLQVFCNRRPRSYLRYAGQLL